MENVERIFPAGASQDVIFLRTKDSYAATLSTLWTGEIMVAYLQPVPWESAHLGDVLAWAARWQAAAGLALLIVPLKDTRDRDLLCQFGTCETMMAHVKFTLKLKPEPVGEVDMERERQKAPVLLEPTGPPAPIPTSRAPRVRLPPAPILPVVPERPRRIRRRRS